MSTGELSNGVKVVVVENHEVPLVYIRVALDSGSWTDPADRPGLADATLDMLNEGAGGLTTDEISQRLRALAAELGTGAGLDGAVVSLKALKQNLAPSLDVLSTVVLTPDFPASEWEVIQAQYIQDLNAVSQDPRRISGRVWRQLMYGEEYSGHLNTVASFEAMTTREMRRWHEDHVQPDSTTILVGGDTTLAEVTPLLEARFGASVFPADGAEAPVFDVERSAPAATPGTIYLVDKPGAAQSVVRISQFVGERTAPDAAALQLANMAVGGQFSARINMNLREDKGWTYGASSWIRYNRLPGVWSAYTSIITDKTADGVREMLAEIEGPLRDAPITEAELASGKGDILGSWPVRFEQPGYLLGQTLEVDRYDLPDDWLSGYPNRIRSVDLAAAQEAWADTIKPEELIILVVGDADTVRDGLAELGRPVVELSVDGTPLSGDNDGN